MPNSTKINYSPVKDRPISLPYLISYFAYYLVVQYLPSNYGRLGFIFKWMRYNLVKHIFLNCGKNVDVGRKAQFGNCRRVSIGDNSGIGAYCSIPNDITIGSNVMMAPHCCILSNITHRFDSIDIPMREQGILYKKPTEIEDDVWIGQNALITPGRRIKTGCIIAAGTVLCKDFDSYSIIGGNPSRILRSRL